jgi:hypothetical protein
VATNSATGNQYADLGAKNWTPKNQNSNSSSGGSTGSSQTNVVIDPNNIIRSDINGINQVAIRGTPRENLQYKEGDKIISQEAYDQKREEELNPQTINVAVDSSAVNQYNQYMASQGINNAGEYFEAVRNPEEATPETVTTTQINQRGSGLPERRIAPGETTPYNPEVTFSTPPFPNKEYGGQINAATKTPDQLMKRPLIQEINYQIENAQARFQAKGEIQGNEALKLLTIPEGYVFGLFKGARDLGTGTVQTIKQAWNEKNPFVIAENMGEGISQQTETIVRDIAIGNIPGLVQEGGVVTSQILISKGLKTATGKYGSAISEAERQIWNKGKTVPVENPMFKPNWNEYGIKDITPENTPKEYFYIPTEQTELGKTFNPETPLKPEVIDANAGELTPGNYLEASQPKSWIEQQYYKQPGNNPTELQTRLSIKKSSDQGMIIRSPEEILEGSKKTTQMKIGDDIGKKTDFFENPERKAAWEIEKSLKESQYKKKLSDEADKRNNNLILSTQPLAAAGMIIVQEIPKISELLKSKYAIYKEGMKEGNIIIREAPITSIRTPDFIPIAASMINNPTRTGSFGGSVTLMKMIPATKIDLKNDIRIRSINRTQSKTLNRQQTAQITSAIQIQKSSQTQTQTQVQTQAQVQTQKQILKQPTMTVTKSPEIPNPPKNTPFPKFKSKKEETKESKINIKVRRRGIFQNVGQEENINLAINKGENIVKNTAAASYKLEKEGRTISDFNPGKNFERSKREAGVFIQKRSNRIGTTGEKNEITRMGILTSRIKRSKGRVNKWEF